ncbi:hypothetical protein P8452_01928 [Trifolium repens]|nr:hypothetical protein P8452_01928 [Trifolium repens]
MATSYRHMPNETAIKFIILAFHLIWLNGERASTPKLVMRPHFSSVSSSSFGGNSFKSEAYTSSTLFIFSWGGR